MTLKSFNFNYLQSTFNTRLLVPEDREIIEKGFGQLSEISKHMRFFRVRNKLTDGELDFLTHNDGITKSAWGISENTPQGELPVAIGRFIVLTDEPEVAEIAITVIDSYQNKGLGKMLYGILNLSAKKAGIKKFRTHILSNNYAAIKKLKQIGGRTTRKGEIIIIEMDILEDDNVKKELPILEDFVV